MCVTVSGMLDETASNVLGAVPLSMRPVLFHAPIVVFSIRFTLWSLTMYEARKLLLSVVW